MEKLHVGDSVRILDSSEIQYSYDITEGRVYEIVGTQNQGDDYDEDAVVIVDDAGDRFPITFSEYDYVEKV